MKIQLPIVASLFALVGLASSAAAFSFDGNANQVMGTQEYQGTKATAKFYNNGYSFTPAFSEYHDLSSSGTYQTFSGRLGYDKKLYGIGINGGMTPKLNGYGNAFAGVDAIFSITPTGGGAPDRIRGVQQGRSGSSGKGLARVDLGGGVTYTDHRDNLGAGNIPRAHISNIGQTTVNGSIGLAVLENLISFDIAKSAYDHNLGAINARLAQVENLTGLPQTVRGYPNTSTSVRLELTMVPAVTPYGTYTHSTFMDTTRTDAYTVGGYVDLDMLEITGSYTRYTQANIQAGLNYFSMGAGLRF
jgi:hypothetical protein